MSGGMDALRNRIVIDFEAIIVVHFGLAPQKITYCFDVLGVHLIFRDVRLGVLLFVQQTGH